MKIFFLLFSSSAVVTWWGMKLEYLVNVLCENYWNESCWIYD